MFKRMRNVSLIFAWIGAILSGLGAFGSFALNMIITIYLCYHDGANLQGDVNLFLASSALLEYFGTGFIASILLLVGINRRSPILIKGYIAYGVLLAALNVLLISIHNYVTNVGKLCNIAKISGNIIFCCILFVHYATLQALESEKKSDGKVLPPKDDP